MINKNYQNLYNYFIFKLNDWHQIENSFITLTAISHDNKCAKAN